MFLSPVIFVALSLSVFEDILLVINYYIFIIKIKERRKKQRKKERQKRQKRQKRRLLLTFGNITSLIVPKPLQVFILEPGHVTRIVLVILSLRPLRHFLFQLSISFSFVNFFPNPKRTTLLPKMKTNSK